MGMKYLFQGIQYLSTKNKELITKNDFRQDLFMFLVYFLGFYAVSLILDFFDDYSKFSQWTMLVIILIIQIIFFSVVYIFSPIYLLFKSPYREQNRDLENYVFEKYGKKYKVMVIDADITNAFATGILPFSKIVLIGRSLMQKLTEEELKSVIAHEIGHLHHNHLLKAFFFHVLISTCINYLWVLISINVSNSPYYIFIFITFFGLINGIVPLFLLGLLQKKSEKEADRFAAEQTLPETTISLLNKLNLESKGLMQKWSWNYPTLDQRILNIKMQGMKVEA